MRLFACVCTFVISSKNTSTTVLGTPPASVFIISIGILLYFFKTLKCEIPLCVCVVVKVDGFSYASEVKCVIKSEERAWERERERGRASGEYFSESSSESGSRQERKPPFFFPRSPELLLVKHDAGLRTSKKKMLQRGYWNTETPDWCDGDCKWALCVQFPGISLPYSPPGATCCRWELFRNPVFLVWIENVLSGICEQISRITRCSWVWKKCLKMKHYCCYRSFLLVLCCSERRGVQDWHKVLSVFSCLGDFQLGYQDTEHSVVCVCVCVCDISVYIHESVCMCLCEMVGSIREHDAHPSRSCPGSSSPVGAAQSDIISIAAHCSPSVQVLSCCVRVLIQKPL